MAKRVSEYIEHAFKRRSRHANAPVPHSPVHNQAHTPAQHSSPEAQDTRRTRTMVSRAAMILLGAVLVFVIVYAIEFAFVSTMDVTHPQSCTMKIFSGNARLCENLLYVTYDAKSPSERGALCDPPSERRKYGTAATLCSAYDDVLSERMHAGELQEFGIAVWEPSTSATEGEQITIRTALKAHTVVVLCDGSIITSRDALAAIDTPQAGYYEYNLTLPPGVRKDCSIIATTESGSVTSKAFSVLAR